jgi:diguanylate cyclase (GGDEF)-like protein
VNSRIQAKRDQIITEQVARETPWVMLILAALIVFFDTSFALVGIIAPIGYYISDIIQGVFFVGCAMAIRGGLIPARYSPWVFAAAIVVNAIALSYQYSVDNTGTAVGVIVMTMVLFGGLLAMWKPFLISSAIMVAIVSYTLATYNPDFAPGWIVTVLTGVGASAALLFARRRSAWDLAVASITIEDLATRDQATGLLNRHGLNEAATQLRAIARRTELPMFAVFIDIVGLKQVNDKFGHTMGDQVISRVAKAVVSTTRDADVVARWGGDEFLVLGVGPTPSIEEFIERIHLHLDDVDIAHAWTPAVSLGTAESLDDDLNALIKEADTAMYESRRG